MENIKVYTIEVIMGDAERDICQYYGDLPKNKNSLRANAGQNIYKQKCKGAYDFNQIRIGDIFEGNLSGVQFIRKQLGEGNDA